METQRLVRTKHQTFSQIYQLGTWKRYLDTCLTLGDCFFSAVQSTKNANHSKCRDSDYGIGFDILSLMKGQQMD